MPDFEKILLENISHNMILDRDGVLKAMEICYLLGLSQKKEEEELHLINDKIF